MKVLVDDRNEKYYIITLKNSNQIKISKRANKEENLIQWLKSIGATEIKWVRKDENKSIIHD